VAHSPLLLQLVVILGTARLLALLTLFAGRKGELAESFRARALTRCM